MRFASVLRRCNKIFGRALYDYYILHAIYRLEPQGARPRLASHRHVLTTNALMQEPTLGDILEEQPAGFIQARDSASTAGKAIATVEKAVRVILPRQLHAKLTRWGFRLAAAPLRQSNP